VFPSPTLGLKGYEMDRIQELLSNITNLSDDELNELRDLVVQQLGSEEEPDGDEGAPDASVLRPPRPPRSARV
jgi:hypothetical protein